MQFLSPALKMSPHFRIILPQFFVLLLTSIWPICAIGAPVELFDSGKLKKLSSLTLTAKLAQHFGHKLIYTLQSEEGDACSVKSVAGNCTAASKCFDLEGTMALLGLAAKDVPHCGFSVGEEIICCVSSLDPSKTNFRGPTAERGGERAAVKACRIIEQTLEPYLEPHIIGGTAVIPGQFPHMAAIGYASIGHYQTTYDFRCGGALIDKRFVLTAAHCVNRVDSQPSIVRLGVTNFNDEIQMRNVLDILIRKSHIHPDYRRLSKYHDIAIIELASDAEYSSNVHPACLYTNPLDPAALMGLNVTGWGSTDVSPKTSSNSLLRAIVHIVPVARCNESFREYRTQLSHGISDSQLCTLDPNYKSGACWGDSGGPLVQLVNESFNSFRIVGVVSAGEGCASATPGLYTRVAAYLDFIESIAWPTLL